MTKIRIEKDIRDCIDCPFVRDTRRRTEDSWGHAHDYHCNKVQEKNGPRLIAEYIEWRSEMPEIPDWCSCKVKTDYKIGDTVYYLDIDDDGIVSVVEDVIIDIQVDNLVYYRTKQADKLTNVFIRDKMEAQRVANQATENNRKWKEGCKNVDA